MKKAICIAVIAFLCLAIALIFGSKYYRNHMRAAGLLKSVGISSDCKHELLDYDYWKDPLAYVNGFEAAVYDVEQWTTPAGWYKKEIRIDDIEPIIEFEIRESAISDLKADIPDNFDECYFIESGREGEFKDWEFYVGLYSYDGLLVVYRGHDLNSDIWKRT